MLALATLFGGLSYSVNAETKASSSANSVSKSEEVKIKDINYADLWELKDEGKIKVGEKYRFEVELVSENEWGKVETATKDYYSVFVSEVGKADDYLAARGEVYVDKKDFDNWQTGTIVKLTVEVLEVDHKIVDSKLKSEELRAVDYEIINGGTSKEEKEVAKKAKEEAKQAALLDSLNEHKNWLNEEVGTEAILSISEITTGAYRVNLSYDFLSLSTAEIKVIVNQLNKQLVYIVYQQGFDYASFTYYIEGTKIGENRSLMNPEEVKFNKVLN